MSWNRRTYLDRAANAGDRHNRVVALRATGARIDAHKHRLVELERQRVEREGNLDVAFSENLHTDLSDLHNVNTAQHDKQKRPEKGRFPVEGPKTRVRRARS